ncbi:MAG: response regulator [Bacteriovoracaceae bacterium]|nr:response regulator [Bacteriovoracaceae bacterium]
MAKIICIDDDRDILETCKVTLEAEGHIVEIATGGQDGYLKAKDFGPDMILIDVMMDDTTDGFHTTYKFRKNQALKYKPILMLTSINQVTGLGFSKDKGGEYLPVDEFIEKPITPDKLIELTNKLLALPSEKINVGG